MSIFRSTIQGGIIVRFVVVIIVLTIVTMLAISFVQQRGEQARRDQAIALADQIAQENEAIAAANKPKPSQPVVTETPTSQQAPETTQLPATGPIDVLMSIVAIGALTTTISYYMSSRRNLLRSL
jgi:Tfp pilus assembly major pilin PilA